MDESRRALRNALFANVVRQEFAFFDDPANSPFAISSRLADDTDLVAKAYGQPLSSLEPHRILLAQQRVLGFHQFEGSSAIRRLFHWPPILAFVREVMALPLHLSADPYNRLHSQRYVPGDELGWHHDKSEFFFNIMLQPADRGGCFQYVRDSLGNDQLVDSVLRGGAEEVADVEIRAGSVVIFKGRENLHRVTPIQEGGVDRISVIFNFAAEEGGGMLDEETRALFFGSSEAEASEAC